MSTKTDRDQKLKEGIRQGADLIREGVDRWGIRTVKSGEIVRSGDKWKITADGKEYLLTETEILSDPLPPNESRAAVEWARSVLPDILGYAKKFSNKEIAHVHRYRIKNGVLTELTN